MITIVTVDLDPWMWGIVSAQTEWNKWEFGAALRGYVTPKEWERMVKSYQEVHAENARGFCHVVSSDTPWQICIVGTEKPAVLKTLVHEAVHLGEYLPFHHDIRSGFPTEELRARLAAKVFEIMYPHIDAAWG